MGEDYPENTLLRMARNARNSSEWLLMVGWWGLFHCLTPMTPIKINLDTSPSHSCSTRISRIAFPATLGGGNLQISHGPTMFLPWKEVDNSSLSELLSCLGGRLRAEEAFSRSSFSSRTQQAFCKYIQLSKTLLSKFSTHKIHAHQRRI